MKGACIRVDRGCAYWVRERTHQYEYVYIYGHILKLLFAIQIPKAIYVNQLLLTKAGRQVIHSHR